MAGRVVIPTGSQLQGPILSDFVPQLNLIIAITNEVNAQVTTAEAHGYNTGIVVRVNVPFIYGMNLFVQSEIVVTSSTMFTTQIDTTQMNAFVIPTPYPPNAFTPAQVVPVTGQEMNIATPVA